MRRRAVLSALAASTVGVAGCSAPSGRESSARSGVTPFEHDASVVSASPGPASPPAVAVRVRNRDDAPHVLATPNYAFPFPAALGESTGGGDAALVLESDPPANRTGECWTGLPRRRPMVASREFGPGETATGRYVALNHEDNAACWPRGEYRFAQPYYLDPPADGPLAEGAPYTWGFTVRVGPDARLAVADTLGPTPVG